MDRKAQIDLDEVTLDIPPFRLMSPSYETPVFSHSFGQSALMLRPIPEIERTLITSDAITIEISFPFRTRMSAVFSSQRGFSKLKIIDCVRKAYRRAYRHATHIPYSTIDYTDIATNKSYYVTYPFGSLMCEKVVYSESDNILRPVTDSFPNINEEPQTPF